MSRLMPPMVSNRDKMIHKNHAVANGNGHRVTQKPSANVPMSSSTSVMTPTSLVSDDEKDSDEDGDSSATEQPDDSDSEPDVRALPASGKVRFKRVRRRVAGHNKTVNSNGAGDMNDRVDDDDDNNDETVTTIDAAYVATDLDSDEEDYAAVDEISDGEDSVVHNDENTLLRYAEKDLIQEFEHAEQRLNAGIMFEGLTGMDIQDDQADARRLSLFSGEDNGDINDFDINLDEDPFAGVPTTETLYNDMLQDAELAIWRMPHAERKDSETSTTARKRVRFEEVDSRAPSDSGSDEESGLEFPDLFATEDDPILKQRLAIASARDPHTVLDDGCDSESVYDFDGEEEKFAFELDEDSSSDDYESSYDSEDDGDTTDEESAEEQIARMLEMKRALGKMTNKQPTTPVSVKKVVRKAIKTPTPTRYSSKPGKGPVAGTFALDPTRASMLANAAGTKIQVRPPINPSDKEKQFWERARSVNSSRRGSSHDSSYLTVASPVANHVPTRPFTAQSTLGSMFDGKLDIIRNNDANGIVDDIYPAMLPARASFASTDSNETGESEIQDVDMSDFIALDYSDSDEEDVGMMTPINTTPFSGCALSITSTSDSEHRGNFGSNILEHLSQCRGVVGSFRQNQHLAKHVSSLASHPSKRASASEYNALQKGRRGAGNSPMTPVRKSRNSQDFSSSAGIKKSFSSPQGIQRPRSRGNSVHLKSIALQQTLANNPFDN